MRGERDSSPNRPSSKLSWAWAGKIADNSSALVACSMDCMGLPAWGLNRLARESVMRVRRDVPPAETAFGQMA